MCTSGILQAMRKASLSMRYEIQAFVNLLERLGEDDAQKLSVGTDPFLAWYYSAENR